MTEQPATTSVTSAPSDPALDRLFPELHGFGVKWGLEKTRALLKAAGDPHLSYDVIHVAGTNGKGSVSAMIASALVAAGHRVGLYSSPHLTRFNERFQVNGAPISDDDLVRAADRLRDTVSTVHPTFFEATTAVGLTAFADAGVDVAVVEVGLGGRLDSTNVVSPLVCALTNVGMDHMQFLGDTLAEIAGEKAGIAKSGVPLVTSVTQPDLLEIIRGRAREVGAPVVVVSRDEALEVGLEPDRTTVRVAVGEGEPISLSVPLAGPHQVGNILLAARVLERLPERLRPSAEQMTAGFAATYWPGRLQREIIDGRSWWFDVAHNLPGIRAVVRALAEMDQPGRTVAVVGILGDKDWKGMTAGLAAVVDEIVLTDPPSAPATRRWDPEAVALWLRSRDVGATVRVVPALDNALAAARDGDASRILVTGSCHTVGDAFLELGLDPFPATDPADPVPVASVDFP